MTLDKILGRATAKALDEIGRTLLADVDQPDPKILDGISIEAKEAIKQWATELLPPLQLVPGIEPQMGWEYQAQLRNIHEIRGANALIGELKQKIQEAE